MRCMMKPWQTSSGFWQEAREVLSVHGESVRSKNVTQNSVDSVLNHQLQLRSMS